MLPRMMVKQSNLRIFRAVHTTPQLPPPTTTFTSVADFYKSVTNTDPDLLRLTKFGGAIGGCYTTSTNRNRHNKTCSGSLPQTNPPEAIKQQPPLINKPDHIVATYGIEELNITTDEIHALKDIITTLDQENKKLRKEIIGLTIEKEALVEDNARLLPKCTRRQKERIPPTIKKAVWLKYVGNLGLAKCMCCQQAEITMVSYEAAHVIPESAGGKIHEANLRPVCKSCNCSVGTKVLSTYASKYFPSSPLCNIDIAQILEETKQIT